MRRRRRKSEDAPMSFFSFQDIIACTTGIMVLITLMLTLELLTRKWSVEIPAPSAENLEEDIAKAKEKLEALQARFDENDKTLIELSSGTPITQTQLDGMKRDVEKLEGENKKKTGQIDKARTKLGKTTTQADQAEKEVEDKKKQVSKLREHVEELRKQVPVTVIDRQRDGRRPIWVECSKDQIVVSEILSKGDRSGVMRQIKRFTGSEAPNAFLGWAKPGRDFHPGRDKFVLLVRADAVTAFKFIHHNLNAFGYCVGTDVWLEGRRLTGNDGK